MTLCLKIGLGSDGLLGMGPMAKKIILSDSK